MRLVIFAPTYSKFRICMRLLSMATTPMITN